MLGEIKQIAFNYKEFQSHSLLSQADQDLIEKARNSTKNAYAPYSNFLVAAAGRISNGEIYISTNQENASYPVGICAERVLISTVSSLIHAFILETIAITYHNLNGISATPISPCGICRQTLLEYEQRQKAPIRILLTGMSGIVVEIQQSSQLLPLSFSAANFVK